MPRNPIFLYETRSAAPLYLLEASTIRHSRLPASALGNIVMRLTLRTLLAYLDDVLEPADARQIGEKIAESKEATALVARLREVIRRRRIGSPELAGPGSGPDPNLVSDYLENVLPPGQVVELEKLCQASDMHLAEVAACHKILTMIMGQPISVSDDVRERMYALGSTRALQDRASAAGMPPMTEGIGASPTSSMSAGLPEYLTRRSWAQRYGAVTLIILTALVWMGLIFSDRALWDQHRLAISVPMATDPEVEPEVISAPEGDPAPAAEVAVAIPETGEEPHMSAAVPSTPPEAPLVDAAPAPMPATPETETRPIPPPQPDQIAAVPQPVIPPVAPLTEPEFTLRYLSGDELMIHRSPRKPEWRLFPVEVPIEIEDELASPAPFRNSYQIVNVVDITLEPGTRIQRLPRTAETVTTLLLDRGGLIFQRAAASTEPVSVGLRVLDRTWTITLLDSHSRCSVELQLPVPRGPENRSAAQGGLAAIAGKVRVTAEGSPEVILSPEGGGARWPADGQQLAVDVDLAMPAWALPEGAPATPASRQLSRLYAKEFLPDRTVYQSIAPVTRDRRASIAALAVETMALTDQHVALVPALNAEHQEARVAAIRGLRAWMLRVPEPEPLLRTEFVRAFREEHVNRLIRLLWGFTTEDARDPQISQQLVEDLRHDEQAVRELAFFHVSRLTDRTYDYLPMASSSERRAAAQRWEEYIRRNGGTLLPN